MRARLCSIRGCALLFLYGCILLSTLEMMERYSAHRGETMLIGELMMQAIKMLIATVALSGAMATTAQARDSFSIGINIGGHDHYARHSLRTHRHVPTYYSHHYDYRPSVVYYAPRVHYRHFSHRSNRHHSVRGHRNKHYGHYQSGKRHYKRHSKRQHRRHDDRGRSNRHYR